MSEQKNISTEIKFNGDEKYNKLLCLFHTGTDVKRKLLDTFLKDKQIILLDLLTSRGNTFLPCEDVRNARRKSATIVLEDLVLNTIDKVLWDCLDFFWDCCLKDDSLEDILERHKELLYRKYVNSNNQQDSNSLTEDQWDILFKRKHEKHIETDQEENEQCFSATKGITISHLDSKLNILILSTVCPLFKSVSAVSECQSQISKIAVLQREVKDNEFEKIWDKFEDNIHKISSHCQLSDFFKRKCTIIKECTVNKILTHQNRKSILVQALNFPDFIPDTKLCDDVRKELDIIEFIAFEENLNIARAHCGRKIPVAFTTGQCEEGSYLRNWIEVAENDLQTLSSLHSRQVIDPYQEEVDVAQQTDDTQERLYKHNHLKLVQLITETARDVLADVLKERIPSDGFGASFDGMKNKILPLLDIQERHVLYPENSNYKGDLSDLDISLIYIILRNLNTICPHKNGWGNKPNDGDRCLSANIDRIRIAKNVHVSHCSKRLLNDEDFLKTWKEIRQCIIELVEPLPSCISYGDRIDFLLTSEINPGTEIELFNMHERAKKEERRLEQKINYLQECINDIQYQLNVNNRQSDNELKAAEFLGNGTKQASQTAADMTKKLQVTDKGIKIVKFGNVTLELRIEGEDIPSVEEIEPYSQTLTTHEVRIKYIKEGSIIIGIDVSQSAFQNVGHFLEIIDTLVSSVFKIHIQKGNCRKIQASVSLDFLDNNNEPVSFSKRSLQRVENKEKRDEAAICCDVMGGTESVLLRKHQQKQNDLTICQPILVQRSISDTEQGLRILSCFKKTDQSPGNTCLHYTDSTHINHETRDTGKEKQNERMCNNMKGFEKEVQQMISPTEFSGKLKISDGVRSLKASQEIGQSSKHSILTTPELDTIADKAISSGVQQIRDQKDLSAVHYDTVWFILSFYFLKVIGFVDRTLKKCPGKIKASYNVLSLKRYYERISSGTPVTHVDAMSNKHHRLSSLSIFQRHITTSSIKLENAGSYYTSESEPVIPSFANQEKRLTIFPNSYRNVPNQRVDQVINHNTINLPTSRHITISLSERENGLDIHIQKHVSNTIRNATDANLSQHINTYKSLLDQSSRKMAMVALFYFAVYNLYIKCFLYLILKIKLSGMKKNWDSINRLQTSAEIEESSKNSILTTRGLETTYVKAISRRMEHICDHQIFSARHCEIVSKDIVFVDKTPKECLRKTKAINNELGLKKYFERISSGTPVTTVDSMSNELLRLSSFSNFPSDINISLIKLAKTGFYYSGRRNTKCFSCGVTYDKWKSVDDPAVIHKMLSPSCALVAETRFSSSANQEERTTVVSNNTDSTVDTRTVTSHGLNQSENASSTYEPRLQISSSYNGTSNNVQERQGNQQSLLSNRNRSSSVTGNSQETQTSKENKNATGTSSCQHNTEFESLGMHLEKPKYPNYACLNVRISSFEGWPSYLDQSPRQMALAGFLFAGYHDYTRCFFCRGGLRNWEAGDDPWVEHARWFPKCTFLKQNKGEKFINAVQKRQEEIDRETNATNTQETTPRAQTSSLAINNSTTSTTQSDILQTFAARSVIEMGFPYQQVINAFKYLTTSGKDIQSISVTDVMYILLDDEGHPQQQGATADVTQHASDTNNAGGHRSGSTNTECNGIDNTGYEQNSLCCFDCARIMRTCLVFMKYFKEFVK